GTLDNPEHTVSGGHSGGGKPLPIPNTEGKTARADGTWGGTPPGGRAPPGFSIKSAPPSPHSPQLRAPAGRGASPRPGVGPLRSGHGPATSRRRPGSGARRAAGEAALVVTVAALELVGPPTSLVGRRTSVGAEAATGPPDPARPGERWQA